MLERKLEITPSWDKRDPDPKKNYGIGCVTMRWYVIGPKGAIQFVLMTGWYPHIIKKTTWNDWSDWGDLHVSVREGDRPMPTDLGFHSPVPLYEGQTKMTDDCPVLGGPCYYDGSGLNADKPFSILVHEGGEKLWEFLEQYYAETFAKAAA